MCLKDVTIQYFRLGPDKINIPYSMCALRMPSVAHSMYVYSFRVDMPPKYGVKAIEVSAQCKEINQSFSVALCDFR